MNNFEDKQYKPDFDISDRYIQFSAELLRLSLLAVSAVGSLIFTSIKSENNFIQLGSTKGLFFLSMLFFAFASGSALFHRYYATDYLSYHICFLRTLRKAEQIGGRQRLKFAEKALITAEVFFALGVLLIVVATYILLFA